MNFQHESSLSSTGGEKDDRYLITFQTINDEIKQNLEVGKHPSYYLEIVLILYANFTPRFNVAVIRD